MRSQLARALIASLDGSVERVLERRFWASPSTDAMATVTELRPSPAPANRAARSSADAE